MTQTYVIAEAGVNHNGKLELALEMIQQAKDIGADAIKFQLFSADKLTTRTAAQADYQQKNYGATSQYEMLKALELQPEDFKVLQQAAHKLDIDFVITPFDLDSLDYIVNVLDLPFIKLGSGEITNGPILLKAAHTQRKIILSTGMSTLGEIEEALKIIAFGFLCSQARPTALDLHQVYSSDEAQALLEERVVLLHCTSEYPAPIAEINLRAMDTLANAFGLPVGLSDHSQGILVPIAAVAREACVIEKHFTLDNNLPGPDHLASLNTHDFNAMIQGIRNIEQALGHGRKIPSPSEYKNMNIVRRSLVANRPIKTGEVFTCENMGIKRPVGGLSPMQYWEKMGQVATKDYEKDEIL